MNNTITVAELARQMQVLMEKGLGDHPVIFLSDDEWPEDIEYGALEIRSDGAVALG